MARGDPQMIIRLPADMKCWVQAEAKRNGASLNSEIVRCIRERMDRMTGPGGAENEKDDGAPGLGNPLRRPRDQSSED
ncbi:Arc family DNA-binding protein [Roseixanthobacter liquoris]|uniref:Arc family DNA-binding protein n=1 Tax=Roseixanthobacter liquoris TaxID=3119921 RepID=UPI00372D5517